MKFFKFDSKENKLELVREDIFLVDCFNELLKQDKTKDKNKFWSYCKYLYLVYDNDSFLVRAKKKIDERIEKSKQYVKLTDNDLQNPLYKECEKEFKYWNYTTTMEIRDGNITTMDNINRYSKEADLFALDNKKEIIHDVGKIAKARTDLKRLVIETKELDSLVDLELEEKGRARGGKMTTPHEKGVLDGYIKELIRGQ
jgi:hypothetical protein